MGRASRLRGWRTVGIVVAFGPLWAMLVGLACEAVAFRAMAGQAGPAKDQALGTSMTVVQIAMAVGWLLVPVGLLLVVGATWRLRRSQEPDEPTDRRL